LEAAGQHRVDDDPVALELEPEELAAPIEPFQPLPDQGLHSAACLAPSAGPALRRPAPGGRPSRPEGVGEDRKIGQLWHAGLYESRRGARGSPRIAKADIQ
jgi:hypothetical protein